MRRTIFLLSILLSSGLGVSQDLLNTNEANPLAKNEPRIRHTFMINDQIYLAGNINFVNDQITPPLVRINASDGSLDKSYDVDLNYSNRFENQLTAPATVWGSSIVINGEDRYIKIDQDGTIDESFRIFSIVNDLVAIGDSLLVITMGESLDLYAADGKSRKISQNLSSEYYFLRLYRLSDTKILLAVQNKVTAEFKLIMLDDKFDIDPSFESPVLNNVHLMNVELLPSGDILLVENYLEVNGVTGNGIFIIDQTGNISTNSFHGVALDFIRENSIRGIKALASGKFLLAGRSKTETNTTVIGRLFSTGFRDDLYPTKNIYTGQEYGWVQFFEGPNQEIHVAGEIIEFDGSDNSGVVKLNAQGDVIPSFSCSVSSKAGQYRIEAPEGSEMIFYGNFDSSKNSNKSSLATSSFDAKPAPTWLANTSYSKEDIIGSVKKLDNGDVMVGGYRRGISGLLEVFRPDGSKVDLGENQLYPVFVEPCIYEIVETDNSIFVFGNFYYYSNSLKKYGVAKYDKSYNLDSNFSPIELGEGDAVIAAWIVNIDEIIVQIDKFNSENSIICFNADGSKNNNFSDIDLGYSRAPMQTVQDSIILAYSYSPNEATRVSAYNKNGNLLKENFLTMERDVVIWDAVNYGEENFFLSGNFTQINGIDRAGIAFMDVRGNLLNELNLDITDGVTDMALRNDTLLITGPGAINGKNGAGFYAIKFIAPLIKLDSIFPGQSGGINLTWSVDELARNIDIYRQSPNQDEIKLSTLERGSASFFDQTAETNTLYTYRIVSRNFFGTSSVSKEYMIIEPATPTNAAVEFQQGNVIVNWTDNSDNETGFAIMRSDESSNLEQIGIVNTNETTYLDMNPDLNHTYQYSVVALSSNFYSQASNEAEIEIYEPKPPVNLEILWNRASSEATISWTDNGVGTLDFILFESIDQGATFTSIDTLEVSTNSFSKVLAENSIYKFYLVSRSTVGVSHPSDILVADTYILSVEQLEQEITLYPNPSSGTVYVQLGNSPQYIIEVMNVDGKIVNTLKSNGSRLLKLRLDRKGVYLVKVISTESGIRTYRVLVK